MTWSILAHDPGSGELGVCIATKGFAVGAICPHGHGQHGILATQAMTNPMFGGRGLRLLADDYSADQVMAMLLASDNGREMRQLHVMDRSGRIAQHTGSRCIDWCGSVLGTNVSVSGNMLAGPGVVEASRDRYLAAAGTPFAERLMGAMEAGETAGGDKRGKQSASLRIWKGEEYPFLDLRVDSHPDPLAELRRLHEAAHERFFQLRSAFPTRANPAGIF
jgi:uncharacterized Ntn-hydrolase superfamily protein